MYIMYRAKVERLAGKTDFLLKKGLLQGTCLGYPPWALPHTPHKGYIPYEVCGVFH